MQVRAAKRSDASGRRCRDLIEHVDATNESTERDDRTTRRRRPGAAPNGIGVSACAILQLVSAASNVRATPEMGRFTGVAVRALRGSPLLAGQVRGALSDYAGAYRSIAGLDGKCAIPVQIDPFVV